MKSLALMMLCLGILIPPGLADYNQELRGQIADVKRNQKAIGPEYFHDMGIIARKADDADLPELTAEIVRELLAAMDIFAESEVQEINAEFSNDAFHAAQRLSSLSRFERNYQPSENFLKSALGQSLVMDLTQARTNALEELDKTCSYESIVGAVKAIKKTGIFITGSGPEITSLRKIGESLSCCLSWKPEISFVRKQKFESLYDAGTVTEEGHLRLDSSRSDLSQARWTGEWAYRYTGRDGKGEGVSTAVLIYRKGEDQASLAISTPRVTSTGRMNFPNVFSGEKRSLDIQGDALHPVIKLYDQKVDAAGCKK